MYVELHTASAFSFLQGASLPEVAAEFNRYNGRQLVMGDPATGHLRVGGKFRLTDLEGFLAALEVTHGVKAIPAPPSAPNPAAIVLIIGGASGSAYSDEGAGPRTPE